MRAIFTHPQNFAASVIAMAIYDPIVPRPNDGANLPDSLRRTLYQKMLREELGRQPEGYVEPAPPRDWGGVVPAVIGMVMLAALVLSGLWAVSLWRQGAFEGWASGPSVSAAQRQWRRADRARPLEESTPVESEVEAMLAEAREPVVEVEAEAVEE